MKYYERKNAQIAVLEEHGAHNVEPYMLVNNYGFTFKIGAAPYDARYWANCYGMALNRWEVTRLEGNPRGEHDAEKRRIEEMERQLNEIGG